jgi:hypothetical protein
MSTEDAPSIVPDLETLLTQVEAYLDLPENGEWDDLEREQALDSLEATAMAVLKSNPDLKTRVKVVCLGAKQLRANRKNGLQNVGGQHLARNIQLAIECVKRRRNPAYDDLCDSDLMARVGSELEDLKRTTAIDCIKLVLTDHLVARKIRESGERRRPDGRHSIFDGSKGTPT